MRDQVFISYAKSSDQEFARRLTKWLKAATFNVWLDEEHLAAGDDWEPRIEEALAESQHAIFIVSKQWLEREVTRHEKLSFVGGPKGRRRITVLRFPRGTHNVGAHLSHLQNVEWLEGAGNDAACLHEVVCGLSGEPPGPRDEWAKRGQVHIDRAALDAGGAPTVPLPAAKNRVARLNRDEVHLACDRHVQWGLLMDLVRERGHQVIVVPGPLGEAHDEFLKRIEKWLTAAPPPRIVRVDWPNACPRDPQLLLADLAEALKEDERVLGRGLREQLAHGNLVILQPTVRCFDEPALLSYLTELLPRCLGEAGKTEYALKIVQPVAWPLAGLGEKVSGFVKTLLGTSRPDPAKQAMRFMEDLTSRSPPELKVVKLDELTPITREDILRFCERHGLPRAGWDEFADEVLRRSHHSRDILDNIKDLLPAMEQR